MMPIGQAWDRRSPDGHARVGLLLVTYNHQSDPNASVVTIAVNCSSSCWRARTFVLSMDSVAPLEESRWQWSKAAGGGA
jgi:hypothetical protein